MEHNFKTTTVKFNKASKLTDVRLYSEPFWEHELFESSPCQASKRKGHLLSRGDEPFHSVMATNFLVWNKKHVNAPDRLEPFGLQFADGFQVLQR